jgi:hypothetical protein
MKSDSRWVLYHGTSTLRLQKILAENRLRIAPFGDTWVSLTTELSVAEHFADIAVEGDQDCSPTIHASEPVILLIDGQDLIKFDYELGAVNPDDPVFSWENEIGCMEDIAPPTEVLIDVEPVSPLPLIDVNFKCPITPRGIPSAYIALEMMRDLTRKLVAEKITSERVEAVVRSLEKLIEQLRAC